MTLLSICQNAANNIGVTAPSSIVGNTDPAAQRLYQMARREGQVLSTRANWSALVVEHVFIADGTDNYQLPSDFRSLITDTMWDRSRFWRMRGAMSPQQWQLYKSSIIGRATIERRWRMRIPSGGQAGTTVKFALDPSIGQTNVTEVFVYEYVSNAFVSSGVTQSARSLSDFEILTDGMGNVLTDGFGHVLTSGPAIVGGGVNYRVNDTIIFAGGTYTIPASVVVTEVDDVGAVIGAEIIAPGGRYTVVPANPVQQAMTTGSGAGTGAEFTVIWGGTPQDDWLADTDTSLLDEDLIELGVIWRTLRRLGLAYDEELNEYKNQVDQAVARDGGNAILQLAPYPRLALVGPNNVPEGNFPG